MNDLKILISKKDIKRKYNISEAYCLGLFSMLFLEKEIESNELKIIYEIVSEKKWIDKNKIKNYFELYKNEVKFNSNEDIIIISVLKLNKDYYKEFFFDLILIIFSKKLLKKESLILLDDLKNNFFNQNYDSLSTILKIFKTY